MFCLLVCVLLVTVVIRERGRITNLDLSNPEYITTTVLEAGPRTLLVENVFPEYEDKNFRNLVGDRVRFSYPDTIVDEEGYAIPIKKVKAGDTVMVLYHVDSIEIAPPMLVLDQMVKLN